MGGPTEAIVAFSKRIDILCKMMKPGCHAAGDFS